MKNQLKNQSPELPFFLSGAVFMTVIAGIKYATQTDIGLVSLLVSFAFGGVVGLLAVSKKDTFLKDAVFVGAFAWLLWAFLTPVQTVGNSWVVQKTELLAIITVVIIFLEQDFLNLIRRLNHKESRFGVGFVGILALTIFLSISGLSQVFFEWISQSWYVLLGVFLGWLVFLYVLINKGFRKLFGRITNKLEGKR